MSDHLELEDLKREYLTQLRGVFPLHRALLLGLALLIVVLSKDSTASNVSQELMQLEIRKLLDFDTGTLATTTVADVLTAAVVLIAGTLLQRALRIGLFQWIRRHLSLEEKVRDLLSKSAASMDATVERYFALKKAEDDARIWSKRVASMSLLSEGTATLSIMFLYAGISLRSGEDVCVAALCIFGSGFALFRSFVIFLRSYLPRAAHHRGLAGLQDGIDLP